MKMITGTVLHCRRNGFTVVEVLIVSGLMSLLAIMISAAWAGLGRSSRDAVLRCRITQEANLVAETLARDFGGHLPDNPPLDSNFDPDKYFVGSRVNDDEELQICFDGDCDGVPDWDLPDTVITYQLQENALPAGEVQTYNLIRLNEMTGIQFTVATNLLEMVPTNLGTNAKIVLKFPYPDARDRGEQNDHLQYTINAGYPELP